MRTNTRTSYRTNYTEKSELKLLRDFINEIIADEKNINCEIFCNYILEVSDPSFLAKDII